MNLEQPEDNLEIRFFIIALLPPLIFMAWIRNLRYLAPVSMVANVFMGLGLGITFYYLVGTGELKVDEMQNMLFKPPFEWPEFFSLTIFAMEAIGVVMPLENSMKTPRSMLGICGVLNIGMSGVTLVYILLGFLGYLRYGELVEDSITLSLDKFEMLVLIHFIIFLIGYKELRYTFGKRASFLIQSNLFRNIIDQSLLLW